MLYALRLYYARERWGQVWVMMTSQGQFLRNKDGSCRLLQAPRYTENRILEDLTLDSILTRGPWLDVENTRDERLGVPVHQGGAPQGWLALVEERVHQKVVRYEA